MFDDGIQSYFGESDSDFFGDTSNDMIFGEGYGEQAVSGAQFFSEAVGFSSDGGEFISEATTFDTMSGDYFVENSENKTDSDLETDSKSKHKAKDQYHIPRSNTTHITPETRRDVRDAKEYLDYAKRQESGRRSTVSSDRKHSRGYAEDLRHAHRPSRVSYEAEEKYRRASGQMGIEADREDQIIGDRSPHNKK